MGVLIRIWKTMPMPAGAIIGENGAVTWLAKGKEKTGKLAGTKGRVSVQSDTWTAQFADETGKVWRISTKTSNRKTAGKVLAQYVKEIEHIKRGVVTREELNKVQLKQSSAQGMLEQFRTKMIADGCTANHVAETLQKITTLFQACEIDTLANIRQEIVEGWIANEIKTKKRSPRTINSYIIAVKSFAHYLTNTGIFSSHPLKSLRNLSQELDQRKVRRAMTKEEIDKLLNATASGVPSKAGRSDERVLIYRLLLGTGLRSTELSLLTPCQIDFKRCRMTIEAAKTKNKKADVLPIRSDLIRALQERIEAVGIKAHERIFHHNQTQIREAFYVDLSAAGIERKNSEGRCIDVHSMRKTFGTLLAMAGVPLTTVQRLMRHSTPQITAKLYADVDPMNMAQALELLPALCPTSKVSQQKAAE